MDLIFYNEVQIKQLGNGLLGITKNKGRLPFTWKTMKFQLENQMVCIIPFGRFLKSWAAGKGMQMIFVHFACYPSSVKTN